MTIKIKVCGVTTIEAVQACIRPEVVMIGGIFDCESPNNLNLDRAALISSKIPDSIKKVAFIAPNRFKELDNIIYHFKPDYIQIDGKTTAADFLKQFPNCKIKLIQSFKVDSEECLKCIDSIQDKVEFVQFETFYEDSTAFREHSNYDWQHLKKTCENLKCDWILSSNVNRFNISNIAFVSGAQIFSVSKAFESSPGVLDPEMIETFLHVVRNINKMNNIMN